MSTYPRSSTGYSCFSTSGDRSYLGGEGYSAQYAPPQSAPSGGVVGGYGSVGRPAVVAAAANKGPTEPIVQSQLMNQILGHSVALHDFDSNGYNAEGGGPVSGGSALSCDFDKHPCCWANVPPPEDQLDWQLASVVSDPSITNNVPSPSGNYLIAHASNAVSTDEAQFASCAIACASSEIVVRARHWQSENVLLQVCLKESFPKSADVNPPMNCQELPYVAGLAVTEVVLPKASLVDVVFIASNFVGDGDDIAILDDIEVFYETSGEECTVEQTETKDFEDTVEKVTEKPVMPPSETSTGSSKAEANELEAEQTATESTDLETPKVSAGLVEVCEMVKCNFESGTTCLYKDVYQTESLRGMTTKFKVVSGQYMNRITGVKEGTEGKFYAATFLFPRESAGLAVTIPVSTDATRLRFQFYEGTHGVQLKACCDNIDNCSFQTDKFVSISDRTWKLTEITCPAGTTRVIFVCQNTRTNQGACAIDDIQVIDPSVTDLRSATSLC